MCEKYNGFTNRETWLVGVHGFFNEMDIEDVLRDAILDNSYGYGAIANNPELGGVPRALELWLADWMKQQMDDYLDERWSDIEDRLRWDFSQGMFLKDLLSDHKINWLEIAEHYQEQIDNALTCPVAYGKPF